MRWGLGPVFIYECLANSRRWQTYAIRSIGVAVLLGGIATIAMSREANNSASGWRQYAKLGESYFYSIIGVELTLVLLVAPAATAGAICVDRARGTLTHVLATDLSDPEIVLGKLAARLLPVFGLVACSWPVLALSSLLGGIDPVALTFAFAIILAVALLGCAMAIALSVWARKPHEVVLVVYTAWMLVMLIWPIWYGFSRTGFVNPPEHWSLVADPYYLAFAPYSAPGDIETGDYLGFFAATLGASAALVVLAVWRMRPVARRGTDENRRGAGLGRIGRLTRWLPGPSLDGNPVLWREWHRSRPSRWMLFLILLMGGGTSIACLIGAVTAWTQGVDNGPSAIGIATGMFGVMLQVLFGLLMLAAVAPTSMAEERQRGSLDLLAATTLSTPTIVLGKWLGVLRPAALLAIVPGLWAFAMATASRATPPGSGPLGFPRQWFEELSRGELLFAAGLVVATILVHGALLASVGVALATWVARQGRAVALSIGFAVTLAIGWPIFAESSGIYGRPGHSTMALSPIGAVGNLTSLLMSRVIFWRDALWATVFGDLECLVLALGMLWLTVGTFDGRFGRIPERPRRTPILADVVVILAALLGVGGVYGAIVIGTRKVLDEMSALRGGVASCFLLTAVGFVLLALLAASSSSRRGASGNGSAGPGTPTPDRTSFARQWWSAFRPALLVAVGPALVIVALATAPVPAQLISKGKNLPGGGSVEIQADPYGDISVYEIDASGVRKMREPTAAEIAEVTRVPPARSRGERAAVAVVGVLTILAHGAAFVSLGAALEVWRRRRAGVIAATIGLVLFVAVGWPLLDLLLGYPTYSGELVHQSLFAITLAPLSRRLPFGTIAEVAAWTGGWAAILVVGSAILCGLAIRTVGRRSRVGPPAEADAEVAALQPAGGDSGSAAIRKGEKWT